MYTHTHTYIYIKTTKGEEVDPEPKRWKIELKTNLFSRRLVRDLGVMT